MNFDLFGIGTPTFFYREPKNIKNFIQNLMPVENKHCFLFCTHGSVIGNTFYYMNKELARKGYLSIGTFDSYADSSIQFYPEPMHTAGHPDQIELQEAIKFGKKVCELSSRVSNGEISLIPQFSLSIDIWWAKDSKSLTLDLLREVSPRFMINNDKCTLCMTCQEECPVGAIDINRNPPEIQKEGFIFCWFCQKICPEGAIETDWTFMRKVNRGNLKKYISELKIAEEKGLFRPYVNYKDII
jgi:ferredoxin